MDKTNQHSPSVFLKTSIWIPFNTMRSGKGTTVQAVTYDISYNHQVFNALERDRSITDHETRTSWPWSKQIQTQVNEMQADTSAYVLGWNYCTVAVEGNTVMSQVNIWNSWTTVWYLIYIQMNILPHEVSVTQHHFECQHETATEFCG